VKIVTYNFHKGRSSRGRHILEEAAHALRDLAPDMLLCQEVFRAHDDAEHQSERLGELLAMPHHFAPNRFWDRGCHGNATFTRFEVHHARNIEITHSPFEKRGILHTRLHRNGTTFEVMNTHFSLTGNQRRKQLHTLLAHLPEHPDVPVLVAGDFNDWHGGLDRLIRRARHFDNALHHLPPPLRRTFPAQRPVFALDRVYVRGFRVESVRVLHGEPWRRLSDHLPVEVVLAPPGSAT
jgi:endonuclease/exonuclease/phosphatase family metal-dependent hydrolase